MSTYILCHSGTELYHHGILGQKWGVRRYQNKDGSLTEAGKKRYGSETRKKLLDNMSLVTRMNYAKHIDNSGLFDRKTWDYLEKAYRVNSHEYDIWDENEDGFAEAFARTLTERRLLPVTYSKYVNSRSPGAGIDVRYAKTVSDFRNMFGETEYAKAFERSMDVYGYKDPTYVVQDYMIGEFMNKHPDYTGNGSDIKREYGSKWPRNMSDVKRFGYDKKYLPNKKKG